MPEIKTEYFTLEQIRRRAIAVVSLVFTMVDVIGTGILFMRAGELSPIIAVGIAGAVIGLGNAVYQFTRGIDEGQQYTIISPDSKDHQD